jgi:hypothetical protein
LRGLSPGTQKIFTLTEGERIHHGLELTDVWPCVTSLVPLDESVTELNAATFRKHYRDQGERCWLIRSCETELSSTLRRYLDSVPANQRATTTCTNRDEWYRFKPFPVSKILVASGFIGNRPKVVRNVIGAHHVGSVYGVFGSSGDWYSVARKLREFDFGARVVKHSGRLKKVEVRQLNSVLNDA